MEGRMAAGEETKAKDVKETKEYLDLLEQFNKLSARVMELETKPTTALSEKQDAINLEKEERVKVMIHPSGGEDGGSDVAIGINGRVILVQRGQEVEIGVSYVKQLENCKYTIYTKDAENHEIARDVLRFPMSYDKRKAA
jgi:hypothetical protein